MLAEHVVRDLVAHVDDADVTGAEAGGPRLRREGRALHDDDGGGGAVEEGLEGGDGLLHGGEALGERGDAEVAADGDVAGAHDDANRFGRCGCVGGGHAQMCSNSNVHAQSQTCCDLFGLFLLPRRFALLPEHFG